MGWELWTQASRKLNPYCQRGLLQPLKYYDRNKPVTLQCDASLKGLRACIIQDGHPIAFVSKSLTDTETQYANIKRELLAIMYMAVRSSTLTCKEEHLWLKQTTNCWRWSAWRILLQLQLGYRGCFFRLQQYDMTIMYRPGKEMLLADALSHLPSWTDTQIKLDLRVDAISISASLGATWWRLQQKHNEIQSYQQFTDWHWMAGLNRCTNVPRIARNYWDLRDELSIEDDHTHERWMSHHPSISAETLSWMISTKVYAGINKALTLARMCVYWPGMEADVTDYIKRCLMCIESRYLPIETLHCLMRSLQDL